MILLQKFEASITRKRCLRTITLCPGNLVLACAHTLYITYMLIYGWASPNLFAYEWNYMLYNRKTRYTFQQHVMNVLIYNVSIIDNINQPTYYTHTRKNHLKSKQVPGEIYKRDSSSSSFRGENGIRDKLETTKSIKKLRFMLVVRSGIYICTIYCARTSHTHRAPEN